mmetsp:Transcript_19855/g.46171  ORF Transcript_19855/g.46171 Transcript_19855/m.46171 type:complete len:405 (-) Transcript_19855:57-1271(-)
MSVVAAAIWAAVLAVARPLLVCVAGMLMAKYRLAPGSTTWRDLGRLNAELLMPCLCLAAFTKGIHTESLSDLWLVLVLAAVLPMIWLVIGICGAKLFLAKDQQQYAMFAGTAVAYQNGFAIPYPILVGLAREVDFLRERGDEFSAAVAILWSFPVLLQIWTIGFYLYGKAARSEEQRSREVDSPEAGANPADSKESQESASNCKEDASPPEDVTSMAASKMPRTKSTTSMSLRAISSVQTVVSNLVNPLLVSLFVAAAISLSPMRETFVKSVFHEWLDFIGTASVPLALLQLGAGMVRPPADSGTPGGLTIRSASTIAFFRLVVANVVGAAVVTSLRQAEILTNAHTALALYIACATPTAANLVLVASVQHAYLQPLSLTIFLMQCASVLTMTVSIAIFVVALS